MATVWPLAVLPPVHPDLPCYAYGLGDQYIGSLAIGHWVTAALPLGVRVVVIEGLSVPAGAHGAPPWAIGLRAPPRNEVNRPTGGEPGHTHKTDTRTSQTNLKTNPTHRPRTARARPHRQPLNARVITNHTTHPIKLPARAGGDRGSRVVTEGDGAQSPDR